MRKPRRIVSVLLPLLASLAACGEDGGPVTGSMAGNWEGLNVLRGNIQMKLVLQQDPGGAVAGGGTLKRMDVSWLDPIEFLVNGTNGHGRVTMTCADKGSAATAELQGKFVDPNTVQGELTGFTGMEGSFELWRVTAPAELGTRERRSDE